MPFAYAPVTELKRGCDYLDNCTNIKQTSPLNLKASTKQHKKNPSGTELKDHQILPLQAPWLQSVLLLLQNFIYGIINRDFSGCIDSSRMLFPAEGTGHQASVLIDELGDAVSTVGVTTGEGARAPFIGIVTLQADGALKDDLQQRGNCWATD